MIIARLYRENPNEQLLPTEKERRDLNQLSVIVPLKRSQTDRSNRVEKIIRQEADLSINVDQVNRDTLPAKTVGSQAGLITDRPDQKGRRVQAINVITSRRNPVAGGKVGAADRRRAVIERVAAGLVPVEAVPFEAAAPHRDPVTSEVGVLIHPVGPHPAPVDHAHPAAVGNATKF
ncbi:MAG: hypothetical protein GWN62_35730 [Aliifodinibius sp.]|nr:hypothetical protein [Fodinibius sp.]